MCETSEWGIRSFLAPVITRILIYGTNPFDVESVLSQVESLEITSSNMLQESWLAIWRRKAGRYLDLAEEAVKTGNRCTAYDMYRQTAQCWYSIFLINFSDMAKKIEVYNNYVKYYKKAMAMRATLFHQVEIPFREDKSVPAYLHLPGDGGPFPCAIIFAGLGSCKEEMDILAKPLLDRGIAALIPDMPGCGESLFNRDIKCRMSHVKRIFKSTMDFAQSAPQIDSQKTGVGGLCMGGGYAYKAASLDDRFKFCTSLFPLYINEVTDEVTPGWMKKGPFYEYQTGGADLAEFLGEMGLEKDEKPSCPFYMIHGKHDNWMTLDKAMKIYEKAAGGKEILIVDDDPVYYQGIAVTHTMPVGEQLHWVKHKFADWIKKITANINP